MFIIDIQKEMLDKYQKAINEIDDYFEYRHDSEVDKKIILGIIDSLTREIKRIGK